MASKTSFRKLERSSQTPAGWRLATVEEAKENLDWIKSKNLLELWDRARLLDGWIGGQGYNFNVEVGFRSCLGYMLVVEQSSPDISYADDRDAALYSEVPELNEEGRSATALLCTEDSNEEVLYWLMGGKTEGDATKKASEVVSALARKWQGLHEKRPRQDSLASLEALRIDFQRCLNALLADTEKSLRASMINSEQGMIINVILEELSSVVNGSDQVFQIFKQEVRMETVWCVAVETIAWQTFNILSRNIYGKVVKYSDSSLKNMVRYAYDYVQQALGQVWKGVEAAAKEGRGDIKRFPMFECKGITVFFGNTTTSPDVLSTFLLAAAYDADVSLVKRLMERGVQPSVVSEENGNTVLHYAAEMMQDLDRYKIADTLLAEDEISVDAIGWEHRTALHIASKNGDDTMCTLLLKYNASLTIRNSYGYTPLHMAFRRSYDEVVRVLISADGEDTNKEGDCLVNIKDHGGETPLDYAIQYTNVNIVVWLLSMSRNPESYFEKLKDQSRPLSAYLRESSRMGYVDLVQKLLDGEADPFEGDDEGKTALHYAAECEEMTSERADPSDSDDSFEGTQTEEELAWEITKILLFDKKKASVNWGKASATDKYGRNVLHVAAFLGRKELCRKLLGANRNLVDSKDRDGQSALYYAVAGRHDDISVIRIILEEQGRNQIFVKDFSQTTPLHVAAAGGNLKMVVKLLSEISGEDRKDFVEAPDVLGQTALHKAASGGHVEVVKKLLEEGADPLKERDSDGKTALDFAAQADGDQAVKIVEVLLSHYKSDEKSTKQKGLLLFTSTVGIGLHPNSSLAKYLRQENSKVKETLGPDVSLKVAATLGDIDMTLECLTRGANIALIRDEQWRTNLSTAEEKKNVQDVLKQIKSIVEQGTDKPALEDNLGRSPFAIGLAALFLNPFVKSPVTVGISGEWGMGKSSVMIQTESILLKTAAQLAFKNSFKKSNLLGKSESKLSVTGQGKQRKIAHEIERLERRDGPEVTIFKRILKLREFWKALRALCNESVPFNLGKFNEFLENYQPKYHDIFKCLAIMDRRHMFEEQEESGSGSETNGEIPGEEDLLEGSTPSILTVRYNAWHYRNETEAWAGLAVEITKELEATMTVAHKLRTSWIYNWKNRRNNICFGVILPFFFALMVAIWFSTIVWFIFNTEKHKDLEKLKYGGLPASLIVAVRGVGKSVISFVKPISSQVVDYICLPDHSQKLGYHQKVIDDIHFLKESLYYKRSLKWEVFAFIWCCITWSWDDNYVSRTKIPKMNPAFGHNLRMIVFVDDLDRCDETVILKVLSAVNLVLATCHVNVILSMENSMIQRAILRKYGDSNRRDNKLNVELAEKYLRKIVQLPLHLPDPSDKESNNFLRRQLGMWDSIQGSTDPAAEKGGGGGHGRRKGNPKFQMATATRDRFGEDKGREEYIEQSLNKLQRVLSASGTYIQVQKGLGHEEEQIRKTMEKAEGSGVELEVKTEIHETTFDRPQDGSGAKEAKIDMDDRPHDVKTVDEQMQEGSRSKRDLMDDLSCIISAMLIPKYTPGERSAFRFLHKRCTNSRKLPREWKCLMAYHRLAWNILYLTFHQEDVNPVEGWQVQLIAWIFVCWEWRGLINILTKKWNKLEVLIKWKADEGPSLREIVEHYIDEELPADKKSATKKENDAIDNSTKEIDNYSNSIAEVENASDNTATIYREEDREADDYLRNILKEQKEIKEALRKAQEDMHETLKKAQEGINEVLRKVQEDMREVLKEREEMREMLKKKVLKEEEENKEERSKEDQTKMIKRFFIEEDMEGEITMQQYTAAEEREEWIKLRDALRRYNVSMDGIQAFQKFRFYCQPGYLPWPLPKQD